MITSTIIAQSVTEDPQSGAFLAWGVVCIIIALALAGKYSRLFDSGRDDTWPWDIAVGVLGGGGLILVLCAFW